MISFVFSLVLVDRQQRQWRLSQHTPTTAAGWSRPWLVPEPYQSPDGPPAQSGTANAYSGWYNRKKKRAIAKMEISDAFEMRKRVVFAMFVWSSLALWAVVSVLRGMYAWAVPA